MKQKRKIITIMLLIGIILIVLVVLLYYQREISDSKVKQTASTTTTELDVTTEAHGAITNEAANITKNDSVAEESEQETFNTAEKRQNKKLPDNYEWDEKRWGEAPQIVYDFAENQEKFDFIIHKIDSIVSKGDGYVADLNGGTIYYDDGEEDIKDRKDGDYEEFIEDIVYILKNTKFHNIVKKESGNWVMEYNQEEDTDRYIYTMRYAPKMTEEEAWDNGYMKVVGDWYFATIWKI